MSITFRSDAAHGPRRKVWPAWHFAQLSKRASPKTTRPPILRRSLWQVAQLMPPAAKCCAKRGAVTCCDCGRPARS